MSLYEGQHCFKLYESLLLQNECVRRNTPFSIATHPTECTLDQDEEYSLPDYMKGGQGEHQHTPNIPDLMMLKSLLRCSSAPKTCPDSSGIHPWQRW